MSSMIAMGYCICCNHPFSFNPLKVPSTSAITGQREPVCEACMTIINEKRLANGLPLHFIHPDAYKPEEVD